MADQTNQPPKQPDHNRDLNRDLEEAVRLRILTRAAVTNSKLVTRLSTVAKDIEEGNAREALSSLGGLERRIYAIRNLLFLAV